MQKTFLELLFKPAWKWWVSMPLEIFGLLAFITPDWGNRLNLPSLSKIIPWYVFVIAGLIILLLATVWEAANRIHKKEPQQSQPGNTTNQTSGRDSLSAGRDLTYLAAPEVAPPNIFVGIEHQNSVYFEEFDLRLKPLPEKPDIENILARERTRLLNKKNSEIKTKSQRISFEFNDVEYPIRVEDYLERYKNYEMEKYKLAIIDARWYEFKIIIESKSLSSASNVFIQLYFPDFVQFPSKEMYLLREWHRDSIVPSPPEDPLVIELPSSIPGSFPWGNFTSPNLMTPVPHTEIDRSNEYRIIKADKGNIVEYKIKDLLQNHPFTDLRPIDIWLGDIERSISFTIPVEINAKELPEKTKRFIEVNVTIEGENKKET